MPTEESDLIPEIALVGDLTEQEKDLTDQILSVEPGGECVIYFDSPGGSAYVGLALMTLILLRDLQATGVVTGECSSAAIWPFAACKRRLVTPHSVLLFHPMKWQSEERVGLAEADEWSRHFRQLEGDMDRLLAQLVNVPIELIHRWMNPGRYISGTDLAEAKIAEMISLTALPQLFPPKKKPRRK